MVAGQIPQGGQHGAVAGAEPMEEDDGRPRSRLEVEGVDAGGPHHLRPREALRPWPCRQHALDLKRQGDVAAYSQLAPKESLNSRGGTLDDGLQQSRLAVNGRPRLGSEQADPAVPDLDVPLVGPGHVQGPLGGAHGAQARREGLSVGGKDSAAGAVIAVVALEEVDQGLGVRIWLDVW